MRSCTFLIAHYLRRWLAYVFPRNQYGSIVLRQVSRRYVFCDCTMLNSFSYLAAVAAFAFVTLSLGVPRVNLSLLIRLILVAFHSKRSTLCFRVDWGVFTISEVGWTEKHLCVLEKPHIHPIFYWRTCFLKVIMLLHVVFYFTDSLPLPQTLFSLICHIVYLQNFSSTWPLISLTSISFLASCALVIADHFIWFFYFARITNEARHVRTYRTKGAEVPGFTEIASFFAICVWYTPLFLFLSLSANDNALPVTSGMPKFDLLHNTLADLFPF